MVIRYINPNPEPYVGEVSVVRNDGSGDAHPQSHNVSLSNSVRVRFSDQIYNLFDFVSIRIFLEN